MSMLSMNVLGQLLMKQPVRTWNAHAAMKVSTFHSAWAWRFQKTKFKEALRNIGPQAASCCPIHQQYAFMHSNPDAFIMPTACIALACT